LPTSRRRALAVLRVASALVGRWRRAPRAWMASGAYCAAMS